MKWLNKKRTAYVAIFALALIVLTAIVVKQSTQNVLDEMFLFFENRGSVKNAPTPFDMNYVSRAHEVWETDSFFSFEYKEDGILKKGESLHIMVDAKKDKIMIIGRLPMDSEESLAIFYEYRPNTKLLIIEELFLFTNTFDENGDFTDTNSGEKVRGAMERNNVTREEVEYYRDYYLYDRIFWDWVEGNGSASKFSPGEYGRFEIQDNLWKNVDG